MKLISEITDKDIGTDVESGYFGNQYTIRKASRIIILNDENKIAILNVAKKQFHKLPGGGIEEGEDIVEALKREVLEEVGANIDIKDEVGMVIEYKNDYLQIEFSYCYFGKVIGEIGEPDMEDYEKERGMYVEWLDLDEAINIMKNDAPEDYTSKFILKRDLSLLEEFKRKNMF